MNPSLNPYSRVFSLIFSLSQQELITLNEKKTLKEGIFNEDSTIMTAINEYQASSDEESLTKAFLAFCKARKPLLHRPKSPKVSKTSISKPKIDQFNPKFSSDSMLHLKSLTTETLYNSNNQRFEKFGSPFKKVKEIG